MLYIRRGVRIFAFLAGLLTLLYLLNMVFVPKSGSSKFGMGTATSSGFIGEKKDSIDILVVGDSESYSAISPMEIWKQAGYTAYISGSSGQTLDYTYTMVERALENQSPKYVILETNAIYRKMTRSKILTSQARNKIPLLRYHNRWKTMGVRDLKKLTEPAWTDDFKGYNHSVAVSAANADRHMVKTKKVAKVADTNVTWIEAIQKLCEEKGAKLMFVSTPSTVNWNYERHNGIKQLADALGCEYLDLNLKNEKIGIDWKTDTRDKGDHMNSYGAKKVSEYLAEYFKGIGVLQDRRADKDYAKWNEALQRYENIVAL